MGFDRSPIAHMEVVYDIPLWNNFPVVITTNYVDFFFFVLLAIGQRKKHTHTHTHTAITHPNQATLSDFYFCCDNWIVITKRRVQGSESMFNNA